MEFSIPDVDSDEFFPLHVSFVSHNTYAGLMVESVVSAESGEPVDFTSDVSLSAGNYVVE